MATNSFSELNNYGNEMISFTDDRPFTVTYTGADSANAINATEGDTLSLVFDQTITSINSSDASNNVSIEVDFSAALAPQFSWGTLPSGVTSSTPSTGLFKVVGIETTADFNTLISQATCEIVDQEANFAYTVKAIWTEASVLKTVTTTNNITIIATYQELTVPATAWTGNEQGGTTGVQFTGTATVTDTETGTAATYTITITAPSDRISGIASSGGGSASTSGVGSNIVRTITGTLSEVNTHLLDVNVNIALGLPSGSSTVTFSYLLVNNLSGVNTAGSSTGDVTPLVAFTNHTINRSYTENTINTDVFSSSPPQITANVDTTYGDGTYKVKLNISGAYANPYVNDTINNRNGWFRDTTSSNINAVHILEKTDTVANLNTWLAGGTIEYIPPPSESGNQTLYITLYRTTGTEAAPTDTFTAVGTADATAVSGAGTTVYALGTTASQSITDNMRFFLAADILVVGAGHFGGQGYAASSYGGGGGGAGGAAYVTNSSLFTGGRDSLTTFDVIVGDVPDTYLSTSTNYFSLIKATNTSGTTDQVKSHNGGKGGSASASVGEDGSAGGGGGGGGYGATTVGQGGAYTASTSTVVSFKHGTGTSVAVNQVLYGNGTSAGAATTIGGQGRDNTITTDIANFDPYYHTNYATGGNGGGETGTDSTTPGSGGQGGEYGFGLTGYDGFVVIKLYEFT